jgi:hypothetical protein
MGFVRTHSGELVSLAYVAKIFSVERPDGACIVAVLRDYTQIILARDYSLASLAAALDPTRARR